MSKHKPFAPTPQQVTAALEHVRYEIGQLALLYKARTASLEFLKNAYIETIVIHLNILIEFFETDIIDRFKDDVLAADYGFPGSVLGVGRTTGGRRNKEIAHLTYTRAARAREEWGWDFGQLVPPVLRRAREFITHVLDTARIVEDADERKQWAEVAQRIDHVLSQPVVAATAATTEVTPHTGNSTGFQGIGPAASPYVMPTILDEAPEQEP